MDDFFVVTGGAGFIGSNLCRYILGSDPSAKIRVIDDLSTGKFSNISDLRIDFCEGSILDDQLLNKIFKGAHSVIHLAARPSVPRSINDPIGCHEVNSTGTVSVLEAARKASCSSVIVASSSSVYGANDGLPKRETDLARPMSPYAVSKLAAEQFAIAWNFTYGMSTLAFRFFNVYGPRQSPHGPYAAIIPTVLDCLLRDEEIVIFGDGLQTRDFTFVDSVSQVLYESARRKISSKLPVNLAFGSRTSLVELLDVAASLTGLTPKVRFSTQRVGDVTHSQADGSQLEQLIPNLAPVSLTEGLQETWRWMKSLT